MITRVEIDGFKSFLDFQLDVPPFLALVGPNASGKSNFFDALRLVADVVEAGPERALLAQVRGGATDLFHRFADGESVRTVKITVGLIVQTAEYGPVPMRCRVLLERGGGTPSVKECTAWVSALRDVSWLERRGASDALIQELRRARRAVEQSGEPTFVSVVPGGGRAPSGRLWGRLLLEMRSWRPLVLEPERMRRPAEAPDARPLQPDGGNLAAVLHRLAEREELWRVEGDLAAIIPGAAEIKPLFDERRQEYDFDVVFASSGRVLPRLLSDGTLRALGVLAARHDPGQSGMLAIEEVENGLHPGRVAELVRRLTRGLSDFRADAHARSWDQVLLTTHSPALVSALWPDRADVLVFTASATHIEGRPRRRSKVTKVLPVADSGEPGTFAGPWDVEEFLSAVRRAGA